MTPSIPVAAPVVLPANQPNTFYRGAGRIAAFRQAALPDLPEDWVASCTARFGEQRAGMSELQPGLLLADAIAADPDRWLGPGVQPPPALLVKLLDAGQRLPVHVHPDGAFAQSHLAHPNGKTEAWIILEAEPDARVNLGFARDVGSDELAEWFRTQDVAAMLAATNEVPVQAGDALLCPAGMPHAIGAGILLVELQEPADVSVLLEHDPFGMTPDQALLGLPMELALQCVDRSACTAQQLTRLRTPAPGSLLPADAARFFRATQVGPGELEPGFAVLVVTAGSGAVSGAASTVQVARGATIVVPYAAGQVALTGELSAICCRPPS